MLAASGAACSLSVGDDAHDHNLLLKRSALSPFYHCDYNT
jgi:hypothetical protein